MCQGERKFSVFRPAAQHKFTNDVAYGAFSCTNMPRGRSMRFGAILFFAISCLSFPARGEKLLVQVFGLDGRPLAGVVLSATGPNSTSAPSDTAGRAEIE